MKVWGSEFPVNLPASASEMAPQASSGESSTPVSAPSATSAPASTEAVTTATLADISLALSPQPSVQENIPASALPPEARVLFTEAQMAMGTFGRSRFFLEQMLTANPGSAFFGASAMQAMLGPDGSTLSGHAVQQLLQMGALSETVASLPAKATEAPQVLLIVRDALTGERFRLQAPRENTPSFQPVPGDLLTLYWAGLSMEGPLGELYLRHDRSGDGLLMADLSGLAISWRSRLRNLFQAGLLFLAIVGVFLGLVVLAGTTSDSTEALTVASLIIGSLCFLLYLGLRK